MKKFIHLDPSIASNLNSNLFPLLSKVVKESFTISSSFIDLSQKQFAIFTNINPFICKKINEHQLHHYGFILDANIQYDISHEQLNILGKSNFIYIVGKLSNQMQVLSNLKNALTIPNLALSVATLSFDDYQSDTLAVETGNIGEIFEKVVNRTVNKKIITFLDSNLKNKHFWEEQFSPYEVDVIFTPALLENVENLLANYPFYQPISNTLKATLNQIESLNIELFVETLNSKIDDLTKSEMSTLKDNDTINIVCYRPSYLFKDLVDRFVDAGCVHSDFPMPNCKGYIWMRPQEIWHLEFLSAGREHKEISSSYSDNAKKIIKSLDIDEIKSKSVAIHHGTCFEPLYQFEPFLLARSLFNVKKVVGVCEIEECYSPSYDIANKENFVFVPIGYDHTLFNDEHIQTSTKNAQDPLQLVFVGRAYGTNDPKLLQSSRMAEPKGYRKGGDILLNIASQLKLKNIPFKLHILGQNWEELVSSLDEYGIDYTYYARDKNISYKDYPSVYKKADALLITARCEGGPVSSIEALSLGVPIISTNVGVIKFLGKIIKNGVYSFEYNKKWHIANIDTALNHLADIYNSTHDYTYRKNLSMQVSEYTTDNWIRAIIAEAYN